MKTKLFIILLLSLSSQLFAQEVYKGTETKYLSEEYIEDVWTVDVLVIDDKPEGVIASVNGKITHGDKLRIKVPIDNAEYCDYGNIFTTFYTTINNPSVEELTDKLIPATVKDEIANLKTEKVNFKVIASLKVMMGDLVFIDMGWNDIESIKKYFENREQVTIELQNGVDIKASDYFDIPKNTFVLSGLNSALDRAKEECLKIVEENDRIKSGLTKIKNEN